MIVMAEEVTKRVPPIPFAGLLGLALGAAAFGAVAMGAIAIGRVAIGRLAIGRARIGSLEVDDLRMRKLIVVEREGSTN
jgi:hypothetical protein